MSTLNSIIYYSKVFFLIVSIGLAGCKKSPPDDPIASKITPPEIIVKSQFDLKGVMNMAVLNKTIAGTNSNVTATDDKGNVLDIKIPDAKSFTLNVNSLKRLNTKYLYVSGTLSIVFKNDKKATYNNFVLDTETGSFYRLSSDLAFIVSFGLRGNQWVNGQIQYDAKNVIYVQSNSAQFVQEISQIVLSSATDTTMTATITKFNIIGESAGFKFNVVKNGDILYQYNQNIVNTVWYYRTAAGKTIELTNLIPREPLVLNSVRHFDKVYTDQTFFINDSKNTPLLFVTGSIGNNTSAIIPPFNPLLPPNNEFVKVFTFESDGQGGVRLVYYKNTKFEFNRMPTPWEQGENYKLFPGSNAWYFNKQTKHVFTHASGGGKQSIWWLYDEETNSIKDAYLPYQTQVFSTYSNLLTQSPNYAFFPLKNDFYRVNLSNLEWRKTSNVNYQIYKTSYIGDEKVQFYGVSYLTGNKVLGEILTDGSVKILKEFPADVEVKELVRIGIL